MLRVEFEVRFRRLRKRSRPRKRFRVTDNGRLVWGTGFSVVVVPARLRLNRVLFRNKRERESLVDSPPVRLFVLVSLSTSDWAMLFSSLRSFLNY